MIQETSDNRLCECGYYFRDTICMKCGQTHPVFGKSIQILDDVGHYQVINAFCIAWSATYFKASTGVSQTIRDLVSVGY